MIMNFAKYNNTYPYPSKADFTSTYYYKEGKLVAIGTIKSLDHKITEIALKDCVKEVIVDNAAFTLGRDKYYGNNALMQANFKADLADELGLTNHPKWDKLFEIAWDEEHAGGYAAVYNFAETLAELLY